MSGKRKSSGLDDLIDSNLKRAFQDTLEEGVPDRFMSLMEKLKTAQTEKSSEEVSK